MFSKSPLIQTVVIVVASLALSGMLVFILSRDLRSIVWVTDQSSQSAAADAGGSADVVEVEHGNANVGPRDDRPFIQGAAEAPLPTLGTYLEVIDGCGPYHEGECVNIRSGPGTDYRVVATLRKGVVLKVADSVERDGRIWYRVTFDEWVRYPERVSKNWYVAGDYVRLFENRGIRDLSTETPAPTNKSIIVNRSTQMLYAYDGDELFMKVQISTGLDLTPTPRGSFKVFRMTPSRYMQGPLPGISAQFYDLPGVPWSLYFTQEGGAIHGAYWHDNFGQRWSHGCVNLPLDKARELYEWAELGMTVQVKD